MGSGGFHFILLLALACFCEAGVAAIFGRDTRVPINSSATAVAVLSSNFSIEGDKVRLSTDSLGEMLCGGERFSLDPSLSFSCTGFLVAPDLLVTAGHCMVNTGESRNDRDLYCKTFSWLFDYDNRVDLENIRREKLFGCHEVIYAVREESAPFRDFAVVRLDRPASGRVPFRLAADDKIKAPLSMIGYPFGTPAKLSSGAGILLNHPEAQSFVTNLDAFEGNSGSPVLNALGEVVGILVGGTPIQSFVWDSERKCQRYNHCRDDGTGCALADRAEDLKFVPEFQATGSIVQRIAPVIPFLNSAFVGM